MRFTQTIFLLLLLIGTQSGLATAQTTFYIAPDGNDGNPGTISEPRATLAVAQAYMAPGDTLYMRGGTYERSTGASLSVDGADGARLHLFAYPGEEPVIDYAGTSTGTRGLSIRGDFWHVKGIVVENAGDNGIHVSGSDNIVEQVIVRYNGDSGLQMDNGAARNLILNVDSYENYDPQNNGENADGFAAKFDVGPDNVFRGCRAYRNSDDGFDMWNQGVQNTNGVRVEDSWTFENGINRWGNPTFQGDGNGYKLGHGTGAHVLVRVLAWSHPAHGIDVNGNLTGVTVLNSSTWGNSGRNFYFDENNSAHVLRNNISHGGIVNIFPEIDDEFNSWNDGFSVSDDDFLSVDPSGLDGPRQSDGSLPETDFLHLVPTSPLVNAGTDVGLVFSGSAPDLGAFESSVGVGTEGVASELPGRVAFHPAYPNPFTASTQLSFETHASGPVRLNIYDVLGRRVATVVNASLPAGSHTARWETSDSAPSGLYLAVLETLHSRSVQQLTLLQ